MACRLGAEQLRIARMSLPLLVLPSALATTITTEAGDTHSTKEAEFGSRALEEVKRAVRDQGLPRLAAPLKPPEAAAWVHCIVADQIAYHRRNHSKLDRVESWMSVGHRSALLHRAYCGRGSLGDSLGMAAAVYRRWAGIRRGLAWRGNAARHRAPRGAEPGDGTTLQQIDANLIKLMDGTHSAENPESEVRRLAFAAAEAMGSENRSWHGLVRRYRDELP